jgi:hypothetical protein
LRTPPTPATPLLSATDPKGNGSLRWLRSDRSRPSDLQPSPDLASDRMGSRRRAMVAAGNNGGGGVNGNTNIPHIGLGQFGVSVLSHSSNPSTSVGGNDARDREVDAKEPATINARPPNAKLPRSSPAALLSKLRIQDEELKVFIIHYVLFLSLLYAF